MLPPSYSPLLFPPFFFTPEPNVESTHDTSVWKGKVRFAAIVWASSFLTTQSLPLGRIFSSGSFWFSRDILRLAKKQNKSQKQTNATKQDEEMKPTPNSV